MWLWVCVQLWCSLAMIYNNLKNVTTHCPGQRCNIYSWKLEVFTIKVTILLLLRHSKCSCCMIIRGLSTFQFVTRNMLDMYTACFIIDIHSKINYRVIFHWTKGHYIKVMINWGLKYWFKLLNIGQLVGYIIVWKIDS